MLVEVALNNTVAKLTGMSPAHIMYEQSLRISIDHLKGMHPVQVAQDQVQKWEDIKNMVWKKLL